MKRNRMGAALVSAAGLWVVCLWVMAWTSSRWTVKEPGGYDGRYDPALEAAAHRYMPKGWEWRIFKGLVRLESGFQPDEVSSSGAVGLCQIMPNQAGEDLGLSRESLLDASVNIEAGARYLRWTWDRFPDLEDRPDEWNRTRFALAAYNAGIGNVWKARRQAGGTRTWQQLKPFLPRDTQAYVERIIGDYLPGYVRSGHRQAPGVHWSEARKHRYWRER